MRWFQGIHYRSQWFYNLQNKLKLGKAYSLRFKIAAQYVRSGDQVLDVCSGLGQLQEHLPSNCRYSCIEASPDFIKILNFRGAEVHNYNLHKGLNSDGLNADIIVMIVSLCHFRDTSIHELLESFKKIGKKVVIVEDVLEKPRGKGSVLQILMNYLCQTEYYLPIELLTRVEFEELMKKHGYQCRIYDARYSIGSYGLSIEQG